MPDTRDRIRTFVSRHLQAVDFGDEDDLFGGGLVNSLFAMELVLFLEKEFSLDVNNEDLEVENFKSVAAMARLVARKTGLAAA